VTQKRWNYIKGGRAMEVARENWRDIKCFPNLKYTYLENVYSSSLQRKW
jgi:hypothetical protein